MILFALSEFEPLAGGLNGAVPQLGRGQFRAKRFDNGELFIEIETPVRGEECAILGSFTPPDAQLLSTLLLADTLRKEGAKRVTGLLPYLAYSRQDKDKARQSLAAAWTGAMARASGLDCVITIDVHSPEDERLFPIPLISLSPAAVFASALHRYQLAGASIIAPDRGAVARCEAVRAAAGLPDGEIPWFEKHRDETGIQHTRFIGETGVQAVIVDDILDTGATLVSACQKTVFCRHGRHPDHGYSRPVHRSGMGEVVGTRRQPDILHGLRSTSSRRRFKQDCKTFSASSSGERSGHRRLSEGSEYSRRAGSPVGARHYF